VDSAHGVRHGPRRGPPAAAETLTRAPGLRNNGTAVSGENDLGSMGRR
jgi:hypothetical protein